MCNETNENLEEKDLESKTLNEDSIKEKISHKSLKKLRKIKKQNQAK